MTVSDSIFGGALSPAAAGGIPEALLEEAVYEAHRLAATIGKAGMDKWVYEDVFARTGTVFLTTVGYGIAALYGRAVKRVIDVHWKDELGLPEAIIPWQKGYDLAQNFRREVVGDSSRDPNSLGGDLEMPYRLMNAVSKRLQGLVAADSPACVGTVRTESSRRFLQARSIGAFLSPSGSGPSLLSTLATDFQAFTRAFAAEFLAPAEQLRVRMKDSRTSVATLAQEFRVSKVVIAHQIHNHNLGYAARN